jgi:hypothetical protein
LSAFSLAATATLVTGFFLRERAIASSAKEAWSSLTLKLSCKRV